MSWMGRSRVAIDQAWPYKERSSLLKSWIQWICNNEFIADCFLRYNLIINTLGIHQNKNEVFKHKIYNEFIRQS